ncbi:AAA family ATPase [Bradyrhizobium sp. STM 3809]|uniref:AAA family ATPase n=1 Tax=Bradyrhizobium sp. STM 3809 TaxID=551936 RepID=UPI000240835E|nr:AAA family ATPase [Bradyrhizobium sp. STM 3809]CCD99988.1 hypothetical protein BRAS3809_3110012 [Bradyrhizobium sp. STM 3809]
MTIDTTGARRSTNRRNAKFFAEAGLYVFPSDGKVPLVPRYTKADTAISKNEREAAIEEFEQKHGKRPVHVGATNRVAVINDMWREFPDAVPSISCGPSRLVVLDADQKDGGPEKLRAMFEEHGGPPAGVAINPTKSGGAHFVFRDVDSKFTNKAGLLKKQYGTDVRGVGGQFVGPGSIREDGKTYGSAADRDAFVRAFMTGKLPPLPDYVVELIGAASGDIEREQPTPTKEREVIKLLEGVDWEKHAHAFDSDLGSYDLTGLLADNADFRLLYDAPGSDCSTNRFLAAQHLMREWPDMPASALAAFFEQWPGAGEHVEGKPGTGQYDNRQIAREWLKNQGLKKPSDGEAFDAVDDMDDHGAYIANGGSTEGWDAWQQRLDAQRQERLARAERARILEGERADEVEATDNSTGEKANSSPLKFELERDVAASAKPPAWLLHEVIEERTLSVLYGQPNSGKSLVLLDMLFHIAAGKPWRGRDVKRGCVLYIAAEGPNGTARRSKAWRVHNEIADDARLPLAFVRTGLNLYANSRDAKRIVAAVKQLEAETGLPCVAVAIDTLSAVTPGMDQNKEMGVFVQNCRLILDGTSAAVIGTHHDGKDQSRGMRGGSDLLGAVDATMLVQDRVLKTMKMRDGVSGQEFPFDIRVLNLWTDEKGRPAGAPVAVERDRYSAIDAVAGGTEAEADAILSGLAACETLADYVVEHMRRVAVDEGVNPRGYPFASGELRRQLTPALDHYAPKSRRGVKDPAKLERQRAAQFSRVIAQLEAEGRLAVEPMAGRQSTLRLKA